MAEYNPDVNIEAEVQRIGLCMNLLAQVDLEGIVGAVEMAHSMGPILDPTKYRDALHRGDMDAICKLAQALREPVRIWQEDVAPKVVRS